MIKNFKNLFENTKSAQSNPKFQELNKHAIGHYLAIQDQMNSGTIMDDYVYIRDMRNRYEKAIRELKQTPNSLSTLGGLSQGSKVTQRDIESVISRAEAENNRISDLRSQDPLLKKRQANILKVITDTNDILDKINRGKMNIEDVPLKKNDLKNLFSDIGDTNKEVKSIGLSEDKQESGLANVFNELKNMSKDMSWNVRVGYDPDIPMKRKVIDRLDKIAKELRNSDLTDEERGDKMLELEVIKQQLKTDNRRAITNSRSKDLYSTDNINYASLYDGDQPTPMDFTNGKRINMPRGYSSTIKEGLANEQIKTRGSTASFDPSLVGGPDYFKRAQFLCNQISDAGLGNPAEFGCIDSKTIVSQDYSWKGNYMMVCTRLGTVWGGWYPEMFGCPNTEASLQQVPNKKL